MREMKTIFLAKIINYEIGTATRDSSQLCFELDKKINWAHLMPFVHCDVKITLETRPVLRALVLSKTKEKKEENEIYR